MRIKLFEEFSNILNEKEISDSIDSELAKLMIDRKTEENDDFEEILYYSLNDINLIKRKYGKKAPRGFVPAAQEYGIYFGSILAKALDTKKSIYLDGGSLVLDDKTIINNVNKLKWNDIIDALEKNI